MPVYKRGGIWYARVQVGNRRVERSVASGGQKEAKELEAALRQRLESDRHAKRVGRSLDRTFGEALLEYLKQPETQALRSYPYLLSKAALIRPHLETTALEQVPEAAEQMKQTFLAAGLKPATINRRLALVRRILRLSYRPWRWLKAPLSLTLLTEDNERHVYPSAEVTRQLAAACPDKDAGDALLVIFFTGMRRGEFFMVNADPTHAREGFIHLYSGTKTNRPGRIPIVEEIAPIVARMPLDLTPNQLRRNFETARAAIGWDDLHLHDLRHGYASWLAAADADFLDVMSLLRHVSPASTKRYTHLLDKRLQAAVSRAATAEKRRGRKRRKLRVVA